MKHIFLVNPAAGSGKGSREVLPEIIAAAKDSGIDYEIHRTMNKGDARRYVTERQGTGRNEQIRYYACGGDGTMNEVVSGIMSASPESAEIAVIPTGTGNDFVRNFGKAAEFLDIGAQIRGEAKLIDVIRYDLLEPDGSEGIEPEGYALNMYNIGFDAEVAAKTAQLKGRPLMKGSLAYFTGVASVLSHLRKLEMTVEIDGKPAEPGPYLLAGAANGRFSGGGFDGMPLARVDDGIMNMVLVKSISRRFFVSIVKKYHDGTHLEEPRLDGIFLHYPCKEAVFKPANKMTLSIDGEACTVGAIKFTIIPGAIKFVHPKP